MSRWERFLMGSISGLTVILTLFAFVSVASAAGAPVLHSWSTKLTSARFVVLSPFGKDAVLDLETGLVWERSPSTSSFDWFEANIHCNELSTGGRKGWRLATLQELASLIDPSAPCCDLVLPIGHPFLDVFGTDYWSATTSAANTSSAWIVAFDDGHSDTTRSKSSDAMVWCVRGGQGVDAQ